MAYGRQGDDPTPGSFRASLKDTEMLIRSLQLGVDGVNHWSFVNRGDLDGQWQFVDTWERRGDKGWLADALPHEPSYYVLGLATRHVPRTPSSLPAKCTVAKWTVFHGCGPSPCAARRTIV